MPSEKYTAHAHATKKTLVGYACACTSNDPPRVAIFIHKFLLMQSFSNQKCANSSASALTTTLAIVQSRL